MSDQKSPQIQPGPLRTVGDPGVISQSFTLRDTFAMYALMSMPLLINNTVPPIGDQEILETMCEKRATLAYLQADAMLAERSKKLKYKRKGEA